MRKTIRKVIMLMLLLVLLLVWTSFLYFKEVRSPPYEYPSSDSEVIKPGENEDENITLAEASPYPIIFVHGWMGKSIDYLEYEVKLEREGVAIARGLIDRYSNEAICPEKWPVGISVSSEYYYTDNLNRGIEDYAKELDHAVRLVMNCTGSDKVILIGHSMGGLVSRKYMVDYGNEHVEKLITLATPHYGFNSFTRTEIILMAIRLFTGREKEVDQMRPGSDFLNQLDKDDTSNRDRIVSIGTYNFANESVSFGLAILDPKGIDYEKSFFSNSDVIVKLDSTKLAGAKYYQIEGCSHTELLDFRKSYPKGPISNPNTCPDAYNIVKKEILIIQPESSE
ncbi:alpha/beta hydrolase [Candidatus Woesearchaeota archaeon]|nr:alpha/beta hydrolase [Candidatus Woesearchaeota archaeon]